MWRSETGLDRFRIHGLPVVELRRPAAASMVTVLPSADVSCDRASCGTMLMLSSISNSLSHREAKHDAPDVGARQRGIEHVRVLGQPDAQGRLRHGRGTGQQSGGKAIPARPSLFMIALPSWRASILYSGIERPKQALQTCREIPAPTRVWARIG